MDMLVSNNGDFYDRGDFELLSGITISDLKFKSYVDYNILIIVRY